MTGAKFEKLVEIMARLRGPDGCPWDKQQDRNSLKPMLVEETYEVLEAIDNNDSDGLSEELGDLLLHIVFQAQLGKEDGGFDIDNVLDGICDKLIRRHPHVFGDETASSPEEVIKNWEAIKAQEKTRKLKDRTPEQRSLLEGIPSKLPAIHEAHQIASRAARVGFDWPDIQGVFDKLEEETHELREAMTGAGEAPVEARPAPAEAGGAEEQAETLKALVERARAAEDGVTARAGLQALILMRERVVAIMRAEGTITLARLRDELHTSRRYAQALLEHLDAERVTKRLPDDARVLRRR